MLNVKFIRTPYPLIVAASLILAACTTNTPMKPAEKAPVTSPISTPEKQTPAATPPKVDTPMTSETKPGSGGYYLDDGPGESAPANIDNIPGATLKSEQIYKRANLPYTALGKRYTPMTSYVPYKKQGIASWYGKRFHGKKTSTGEIYDMYAMSAAHTILPLPSYAKVTNLANGRSVIVRVNDRGPFKHDRLIDLSYAAAFQLRLIKAGSGLVEVETIDTSPEALSKMAAEKSTQVATNPQVQSTENQTASVEIASNLPAGQYYVQAGAFKNEANGDALQKRIQALSLGENVGVANVYNNGLYRVKLGPFTSKSEADSAAANIRKQLNTAARVTTQ